MKKQLTSSHTYSICSLKLVENSCLENLAFKCYFNFIIDLSSSLFSHNLSSLFVGTGILQPVQGKSISRMLQVGPWKFLNMQLADLAALVGVYFPPKRTITFLQRVAGSALSLFRLKNICDSSVLFMTATAPLQHTCTTWIYLNMSCETAFVTLTGYGGNCRPAHCILS